MYQLISGFIHSTHTHLFGIKKLTLSLSFTNNYLNKIIIKLINLCAISVAYKFGIIAMSAGIIGVPLGSGLVQYLRPRYSSQCDAMVCASGLFVSAPFVYASLVVAKYSVHWCFICMFVAEVALNLCWSIVADILLVREDEQLIGKVLYGRVWVKTNIDSRNLVAKYFFVCMGEKGNNYGIMG